MRFRVHDAWENVVALRIDRLFRRKAAQIGCNRSDLLPFDADARRYNIGRDNELSVVDD